MRNTIKWRLNGQIQPAIRQQQQKLAEIANNSTVNICGKLEKFRILYAGEKRGKKFILLNIPSAYHLIAYWLISCCIVCLVISEAITILDTVHNQIESEDKWELKQVRVRNTNRPLCANIRFRALTQIILE
jgi:hypothetical protein